MENPFSLIVLACQKSLLEGRVSEEALGGDRLAIAKALLKGPYDHDHILCLLVFLKNFIYIENEEINRIFDKQIQDLSGGAINMGIIEAVKLHERQQGQLEGRLEGKLEVVERLILKLGLTSDEQIADLANVSIEFVKKVRRDLTTRKQ